MIRAITVLQVGLARSGPRVYNQGRHYSGPAGLGSFGALGSILMRQRGPLSGAFLDEATRVLILIVAEHPRLAYALLVLPMCQGTNSCHSE